MGIEEKVVEESAGDSQDVTDEKADEFKKHREQLEKFKPKLPDYVKSAEPCAFSENPSRWITWMEEEVNIEKERRMKELREAEAEEERLEKEKQEEEEKLLKERKMEEERLANEMREAEEELEKTAAE